MVLFTSINIGKVCGITQLLPHRLKLENDCSWWFVSLTLSNLNFGIPKHLYSILKTSVALHAIKNVSFGRLSQLSTDQVQQEPKYLIKIYFKMLQLS